MSKIITVMTHRWQFVKDGTHQRDWLTPPLSANSLRETLLFSQCHPIMGLHSSHGLQRWHAGDELVTYHLRQREQRYESKLWKRGQSCFQRGIWVHHGKSGWQVVRILFENRFLKGSSFLQGKEGDRETFCSPQNLYGFPQGSRTITITQIPWEHKISAIVNMSRCFTFIPCRQPIRFGDARTLFPSVLFAVGMRRRRWFQFGTGGTAQASGGTERIQRPIGWRERGLDWGLARRKAHYTSLTDHTGVSVRPSGKS